MRRIHCERCRKSILTPLAAGQVLCSACEDAPTTKYQLPDSDAIQTEPHPLADDSDLAKI